MHSSIRTGRPTRQRPPPATPLPRWLSRMALLSVGCAVVILFGTWPLMGSDLLMWLTVGRYAWEHGGPPWPMPKAPSS
jgi:hypothetical protein